MTKGPLNPGKKLLNKLSLLWFGIKNRSVFRRFLRFRWFIRFRRLARRFRFLGGPILGALIGLIGGIPGVIIGILLGYLLGRLFIQSGQEKRILDYLESPGLQEFNEGEPGLAAWCALAALLVSGDSPAGGIPAGVPPEITIRKVVLEASFVFTGPMADVFLMEYFAGLALSRKEILNPDLLAESLAARRASSGDAAKFGRSLISFAEGESAQNLARSICHILDPSYVEGGGNDDSEPELLMAIPQDPWKILGLSPETPLSEVKAHYRRLAKLFHPDELQILSEKHREAAARAFMEIKEAYTQVTGEK